jgi:hypothetical protein
MTPKASETGFRNVDLEVSSSSDLQWLVDEFGEDAMNLYCGPARGHFLATFETPVVRGDPDSRIGSFCNLVENLPDVARLAWDEAFLRVFDIGYDAGETPRAYQCDLRPETLAAVARIGASLRITIYSANRSIEKAGQP